MADVNPFAEPQTLVTAAEVSFEPWRRHLPLLRVAAAVAALGLTALGILIVAETWMLRGARVFDGSTQNILLMVTRVAILISGLLALPLAASLSTSTIDSHPQRLTHLGLGFALAVATFSTAAFAANVGDFIRLLQAPLL